MLRRCLFFTVLFLVWIVLSGNIDGPHLTMGLISCALVTALSSDLLIGLGSANGANKRLLPISIPRLIKYLFWLLWELVLSNLHVLRLALSPSGMKDVRPRIIRFQTKLESPLARFMLANSITLTPGTITIELEGNDLFIHAINETTAKGLEGPMEKKIGRIFGQKI